MTKVRQSIAGDGTVAVKDSMRLWIAVVALTAAVVGLGIGARHMIAPPSPVYSRLLESCNAKGGAHVYSKAEAVDGFFEGGGQGCSDFCQSALFVIGYAFVEAEIRHNAFDNYPSQPGLYRFTIGFQGDPACQLGTSLHPPLLGEGRWTRSARCVKAEPISRITSRYRVERRVQTDVMGRATFSELHDSIDDLSSAKTVVEAFDYTIRWDTYMPGAADRSYLSCGEAVPNIGATNLADLPKYLPLVVPVSKN